MVENKNRRDYCPIQKIPEKLCRYLLPPEDGLPSSSLPPSWLQPCGGWNCTWELAPKKQSMEMVGQWHSLIIETADIASSRWWMFTLGISHSPDLWGEWQFSSSVFLPKTQDFSINVTKISDKPNFKDILEKHPSVLLKIIRSSVTRTFWQTESAL